MISSKEWLNCIVWVLCSVNGRQIHLCADPEVRGSEPPPPPESYKNIGSYSNNVPIPLKSQSYQASIQCWAIIGPPEKRHFIGISLADPTWPAYSGICILPPLINLKKKLSESAHDITSQKVTE